jgi:excisionase family DNA binding protein
MNDQALTVIEVADRLNIHKTTVYDLIHTGQLKGYTVGVKSGEYRVDKSELDKYKKKNLVKKTSFASKMFS